ncbi:hypothetical protein [Kamptonema formosum]|uniref:hypothetical protein n=1 Tax=Kamptonema formosum TaxID=331992 RepID=UPI0012DD92B7|nr:hypothetical protein [Oscillatoria sp. PCC 10802]
MAELFPKTLLESFKVKSRVKCRSYLRGAPFVSAWAVASAPLILYKKGQAIFLESALLKDLQLISKRAFNQYCNCADRGCVATLAEILWGNMKT